MTEAGFQMGWMESGGFEQNKTCYFGMSGSMYD